MSVRNSERNVEEASRLHQELNRLYEMGKEKTDILQSNGLNDNKALVTDVKEIQNLLRTMQNKLGSLKSISASVASKQEKQTIDVNVTSHEKQLNQLQKKLRDSSNDVRKNISEEERSLLLRTKDGQTATGKNNRIASHEERSTRLQELVAKMSQQVEQGEHSMGSLVHSSSILGQTQSEYEGQSGHIQTGSKLLSKYEQRERTERILVILAAVLYFSVVYYILHKRVIPTFWLF